MTSTIDKFKSTLKHWYVPLIIGILLILLGIISIMTPLATYVAISMFISVAFLFTGILQIVFAVSNRNDIDGWGWQLAAGIIYTLLGLYIVINPAITMVTLPFVIAFFTFIQAIFGIATAIEFQQIKLKGWGWMLFWAILGLIFSLILIFNPVFSSLYIVFMLSAALIFSGVTSISMALHLKKVRTKVRDFMS
ncbi:HdeD family acid-resistance protein [Sphingobacterium psychroaquaticum]|uniref:Uncharacterized membrane protein HdeD, DUF308 family n=1 Tax=Sphingobacterium psychroaquaticum TaxID=561061 RepID=A0A1X7HZU2_9SPHI|nr:DUF308 domain-containing protein [Sphingobacterium psychroaquaticum]SMG07600.1 Uncharacterized membrane protein HdeD, DUF308 family [Sphingobacterium psychroaquaticum]